MATEDITMTSPTPPPPSSTHTTLPSHPPQQQPSPSIPPTESTAAAHPPTFDLGNLLITDPSPLSGHPPSDSDLHARAQSCAQALIRTLLTTCAIHASPTADKTLLMSLPQPTTPLPREKPLPRPREKTRWERFAEKKGISKDRRGEVGGNKVYDEEKGEWVPKYGYKGRNKGAEGEWIVEVDDEKEKGLKEGETWRGEGRRERKDKARRRERKERANERTSRKGGGGG